MTPITRLVFSPEQVRAMDRSAIQDHGIPGYELMTRAGQACFAAARLRFPEASRWLVICGAGNNAGDGYVIARLARAAGLDVTLAALTDPHRLRGDAALAWRDCEAVKCKWVPFDASLCAQADLIVDALLGTGLDRPLEGACLEAVEATLRAAAPVIAVDIPSGLNAATGAVMGAAVKAALTVTFVGRKQGLYLGAGPDHAGEIVFDDLGIPLAAVGELQPGLEIFSDAALAELLGKRPATSHKGLFGHVLVVGGNHGMGGAVRLAGEAALRCGAGLVTVATRPENVAAVTGYRPELMCSAVSTAADLDVLLERASVIALGPGLGRDRWARDLFARVISSRKPLVLDADGLNLLAEQPLQRDNWILTPHPGEAARLLGIATAQVQAGRMDAVAELANRYGGVAVLKGRGTLVAESAQLTALIDRGNPGMATAGMGDVLTGLIAGLLGQRPDRPQRCAAAAAYLHALAGDRAARGGQRGLLATDLLAEVRACLMRCD